MAGAGSRVEAPFPGDGNLICAFMDNLGVRDWTNCISIQIVLIIMLLMFGINAGIQRCNKGGPGGPVTRTVSLDLTLLMR